MWKTKLKYYFYGVLIGCILATAGFLLEKILLPEIVLSTNSTIFPVAQLCVLGIALAVIGNVYEILKSLFHYCAQKEYFLIIIVGTIGGGLSINWYHSLPFQEMPSYMNVYIRYFAAALLAIPCSKFVFWLWDKYSERKRQKVKRPIDSTGTFFSEEEIDLAEDDAFFTKQVDAFVEQVQRQRGPYVFGIEGAWGVGKSSFVNLCCQKIQKVNKENTVIFKFNPLRYDNPQDVLDRFYKGLIAAIKKDHFEPELEAALKSYIERFLSSVMIQGTAPLVRATLQFSPKSEDEIYLVLDKQLKKVNFDIIVVIDDLDRLDFPTVKKIFFMMRNIFHFSKIKFIICYDIENLIWSAKSNMKAPDEDVSAKVVEFIDKYINLSYRIYHTGREISEYIDCLSNKWRQQEENPRKIELWNKIVQEIQNKISNENFSRIYMQLGTPRKIKRLLSQIVRLVQAAESRDLDVEYNGEDLLNLLLLYIYYPSSFNTLYLSETGRNRGPFSAEQQEPKAYKKSFEQKISAFSEPEQELFRKIFPQVYEEEKKKGIVGEMSIRACYNFHAKMTLSANYRGNLERYLHLIVSSEALLPIDRYNVFANVVRKKLLEEKTLSEIEEIFNAYPHQDDREFFWKVAVDYLRQKQIIVNFEVLIQYAVIKMKKYKFSYEFYEVKRNEILDDCFGLLKDLLSKKDSLAITEKVLIIRKLLFDSSKEEQLLRVLNLLYVYDKFKNDSNYLFFYARDIDENRIKSEEAREEYIQKNKEYHENQDFLEAFARTIFTLFMNTVKNKDFFKECESIYEDVFMIERSIPGLEDNRYKKSLATFNLKQFFIEKIGSIQEGIGGYVLKNGKKVQEEFSNYLLEYSFSYKRLEIQAYINFFTFALSCILWKESYHDLLLIIENQLEKKKIDWCISEPQLHDYWQENKLNFLVEKYDDYFYCEYENSNYQVYTYEDLKLVVRDALDNYSQQYINSMLKR